MTLMPVSNIWRLRLELVEVGRRAVDLPALLDVARRRVDVERLADHVEDVAEHGVADRHLEAVAEVAHRRAARQAVGRLQADGPHPAVADLLGDLGRDDDRRRPSTSMSISRRC